jgi:1,4-alpha-glucan branching enzyme
MIRMKAVAEDVKVTFALPLSETPGRCSVVGDFNQWQPGRHELRRRANGTRSVSVTVPRGTSIRFRYLAEHGHWFNDPQIADLDGQNTTLTV